MLRLSLAITCSAWAAAAMLLGSATVFGQGMFLFQNRLGTEVDARFVLSTDPPGASSVGTNFQVQLFGGPQGTQALQALEPPGTTFRGPAGSALAGYVWGIAPIVPGVPRDGLATVLVRAFDGAAWENSTYQFEKRYDLQLIEGVAGPAPLRLGTSPLVLIPVPEPGPVVIALLAFGSLIFWSGVKACCLIQSDIPIDRVQLAEP